MIHKLTVSGFWLVGALAVLVTGCQDEQVQPSATPSVTTLASGLLAPIGLEKDADGRIWVGESGTGKNDGRVSVISPDGTVSPVITGFNSGTIDGGEVSGVDHILFADGVLYVLDRGLLYKANVTGFKAGNAPVTASTIPSENIAQFVLGYAFVNNAHDSHPYAMTPGPDGALFIADAGANAIIRRTKAGVLSVVAEIPGIVNPTPVGPPAVQSVPTGIVFDGQNFYISTLLGFPFPAGKALVYKMSPAGVISVFQQSFNSLTDVELDGNPGALVLEYGQFGPMGFAPKTGRLLRATGTAATVLLTGLNQPTDLLTYNANTYYMASAGDGSVLKVTF